MKPPVSATPTTPIVPEVLLSVNCACKSCVGGGLRTHPLTCTGVVGNIRLAEAEKKHAEIRKMPIRRFI
jgi:hypothetical protein